MFLLALSMPNGQPLSWVATLVVVLGLIGLAVGAVLRLRRGSSPAYYSSSAVSKSSTEASPRA